MRNLVIWCVGLLAIAMLGCNKQAAPAKPAASPAPAVNAPQPGTGSDLPKDLVVDLGGGVKLEMVAIPAGSFMMGDDKAPDPKEPVHTVNITKPFYLGKYEVTQEQWLAVMGTNPSQFSLTGGSKEKVAGQDTKRFPVEQVSWDDCQEFLVKLNAKTDVKTGKFVLPSEAQWEYACRAGNAGRYCFGDDERQLGEYAWYQANSEERPHTVGEKRPNAFGLYDMHGNVWEWCQDWYDGKYYAASPTDDPKGPATGLFRVNRGGSWFGAAACCRSGRRIDITPRTAGALVGLRVARIPSE